ncbi:MAG: galactokinase, partial [Anaerolineae bacterium]|nr:galactokinase [Anaerolineae bacterium]
SVLEMVKGRHSQWAEYIKGVAWSMQEAGLTLKGWDGVIAGDVPIGAGLSSSAAVEMAAVRAFCHTSGIEWQPVEAAKMGQKTENEWIGVNSGIMDQTISAGGVEDNALLIDCRWLTLTPVPLPPETAVVIMDTMTRRELIGSEYNVRREQCETAAKFFNVPALRDVNPAQIEAVKDLLEDVVYRRAKHVVTENARTLEAADVMRAGDAVQLGLLMNASHASLRDDFEVTNNALNVIVEIAQAQPACYGARMTGGGFGGCAVALVKLSEAEAFASAVTAEYEKRQSRTPAIYVSTATDGASISPEVSA